MSIDIGGPCFFEMLISGMRKPYKGDEGTLTEEELVRDPFDQFDDWFKKAAGADGILEPNAMCLATCGRDGRPSARMVLCKGYGPDGFKFFTNYNSRKANELEANPFAALTFWWEPLKRSVRIEGAVEKLSSEESTEYFMTRPIGSRIGALVSPQSKPIPNRDELLAKEKELKALAATNPEAILKPDNWGGFVVIPDSIEFWQGQENRLHDRIKFRKLKTGEDLTGICQKGANGWVYERLAP